MLEVRSRNFWFAGALACAGLALGCGASDTDMGGARRQPGGPVAGAAGGLPGGSAGTGTTIGGGGTFGNPTGPAPMLGGGATTGGGPMCLEATVAFVVDGSGSMCETFGASTRWQELRNALLAPNEGLISRLQSRAKFGMTIYDGSIDLALAGTATGGSPTPMCATGASLGRAMDMECMQLREVPPAKGNADAIAQMFPMRELGGSTPTDRAMNQVVDQLLAQQATGIDLAMYPQYIILATDGQPNDICIGGAGGDGLAQQQGVIAAVDRAAAARITTFVISLAGGDMALEAHLAEVARHGNPADPNAAPFTPANPQQLVDTLVLLLGQALNCNVE
jgi:hypothetical protein